MVWTLRTSGARSHEILHCSDLVLVGTVIRLPMHTSALQQYVEALLSIWQYEFAMKY